MKKILIVIFFVAIGILAVKGYSSKKGPVPATKALPSATPISKTTMMSAVEKRSIFVPDWSATKDTKLTGDYDRWIFMGNLDNAPLSAVTGEKWYMIAVDDLAGKEAAINKIKTAADHRIAGIVLDLEISALPTDNLVQQINRFVSDFYAQTKKNGLPLAICVYGDLFYRHRPYDPAVLNKYSDEIMIMAYDFHKSRGEPGPNYPYPEFQQMISDFEQYVPPEKLTVIFGMYGYEWNVNEKKLPISPAKALTLKEIQKKFLPTCQWKDCLVTRDPVSKETEIDYVTSVIKDDQAMMNYYIVWFEDEESVKVKSQFLRGKGISSVAYWAWGYF